VSECLPKPFRPQLHQGFGIGGICLIRLKKIRPAWFPLPIGLASENAAHRIAVEWDTTCGVQTGVYIPRRDSSSWLNTKAGGVLFAGKQHHASFVIEEKHPYYSVTMRSNDRLTTVKVAGEVVESFTQSSIFTSLEEASLFFENGSLGYSATSQSEVYDGMELRCSSWEVESLKVDNVMSSYFEDLTLFPEGSVEFDCALLMRNIDHQWCGRDDLCC